MFNKDLILYYLEKKGWSKYRLCKEANLAQSTLSDILTGKNVNPRMDTIQKIADALNVNVFEFFDESIPLEDNDIEKWDSTTIKSSGINEKKETISEEFDEETRAIARNMQKLSTKNKKLLKQLIDTMTLAGDEELKK